MARQRHNAAFVVGSILGGIAGAAAALWKTPQSGTELRSRVSERLGGFAGSASSGGATGAASSVTRQSGTSGSGIGGKMLSFVENATAPIVGVKLGQTANRAGSEAASSVRPGDRTATTPTATHESTGEISESGVGHAASAEELVKPTVPVETQSTTRATGSFTAFPEFEDDKGNKGRDKRA